MKSASLVCLFTLLATPATFYAQTSQEGQVSANGSAEIKHPAELLRVQVELTGKGKDMKEALAKLKERKELAMAQLLNLGAAKDDVIISEASPITERNDRQRQMEMMMMQRRGGAKKPDTKNKQPDPIVVSATLKADVPFKAASTDELLQAGHTLQEKIKAADLGGVKESEKLTPKDEEAAEEMQEMARMMGDNGEPKRGEPTFVYVYKVSPAEHDKALKEAFSKANSQATRLAAAAGAELGSLHSLQGNIMPATPDYMGEYYGRPRMMMMQGGDPSENGDKTEAVGMNPAKVSLKVSVNATFTLKGKK